MGHVSPDKVTGSKGTAEAELASQNTSGDDSSQLPSIIARICGVSPSNTKEIEHSALRLEDCPPSNCADFDARHRNADLEVAIVTVIALVTDVVSHA